MTVTASAPGKLVLLGEYVVLDGATALVMACDRRCRARFAPAQGERCRLVSRMPDARAIEFPAGSPSGSPLVDAVLDDPELGADPGAWAAEIDSSAFFAGALKLGLGSSAAALVAFAGAVRAAAGRPGRPGLEALIRCHRAFQGGAGSGIDVAAALTGGVVRFSLDRDRNAQIGSVRLPKSVGFAGIFAGGSASTPDLVGRYRRWVDSGSARAARLRQQMFDAASRGCAAVMEDDGAAFVAAIGEYGGCLAQLGPEIGADLVTGAHRRIGDLAGEFELAYKVSGAGGGDVGIACGLDFDALRAFSAEAARRGIHVVPLTVDFEGLRVEEHAE
jgi:phosphomevalonate kinase